MLYSGIYFNMYFLFAPKCPHVQNLCWWMRPQINDSGHIIFPLWLNITQCMEHTVRIWDFNNYIINIFICQLANSVWSWKLCKIVANQWRIGSRIRATLTPAVNCQTIQIAWLFEDPATCGLLFKTPNRGVLLKLGREPTLIPNPRWLTVTSRHRGSLQG